MLSFGLAGKAKVLLDQKECREPTIAVRTVDCETLLLRTMYLAVRTHASETAHDGADIIDAFNFPGCVACRYSTFVAEHKSCLVYELVS